MAKHNEKYTREDYSKFFCEISYDIMQTVNDAILYMMNNDDTSLKNSLEKCYTRILHEADYIFLKEDDKK